MDLKEFAKMGGNATYKKYGKDHYVKMGKKSGESRKVEKSDKNPPQII